jgi:hypothetical protein
MSLILKGNPAKISRIGISMRPKRGRGLRVPRPAWNEAVRLPVFATVNQRRNVGSKNAMAQVMNDDLDHEGVVVEKRVIPQHQRTSPLAIIVLIAFALTCAYVFFGGNIRTPGNTPPVPAPTTTAPQ